MYPIDVHYLVTQATVGSRAGDPTRPHRPRKRSLVTRAFVRLLAVLEQSRANRSTGTAHQTDCAPAGATET